MEEFESLLEIAQKYYKSQGKGVDVADDERWILYSGAISLGAIRVTWNLSYIYMLFYLTYLASKSGEVGTINYGAFPDVMDKLDGRRKQVEDYLNSIKPKFDFMGIAEPVTPKVIDTIEKPSKQTFIHPEKNYIINDVSSYALLFFLLHEYSHGLCPLDKNANLTEVSSESQDDRPNKELSIKIEKWCDKNAYSIYKEQFLTRLKGEELLIAKVGLQIALLILNTVSTINGCFGDEHPKSYNRIKDILETTDGDDDEAWSVLFGLLSYELYHIKDITIDQTVVYENFKDAVMVYIRYLEDYDDNKSKMKSKSA